MMIWIVLTVMTTIAAVWLSLGLAVKPDRTTDGSISTLDVLNGQLSDIATQLEAGQIAQADADSLGFEIKRRIISEVRYPLKPRLNSLPKSWVMPVALGLAATIAVAATGLYALLGRPDLANNSPVVAIADQDHPQGDVPAMIGKLEKQLRQSPVDPKGWGMLAWSYFQTSRFDEAAKAYGRASALDPTNAEFLSGQGESLVQAANNTVTPAAQGIFKQALAVDPADPRARYFLAMAKDQSGDHQGAMNDWIALLKSAPAGAPWAIEVRDFIERAAKARGDNLEGRLPPMTDTAAVPSYAQSQLGAPGPTAEQAQAASTMAPADRQAMIAGMVTRLAEKMKANPRDQDGWVRLMRAYMVQGETDKARTAYKASLVAFSDSKPDQSALNAAAKGLGIPGA